MGINVIVDSISQGDLILDVMLSNGFKVSNYIGRNM